MKPGPDMENDPQLAAAYRAGADATPPAHLDDAIRAAARREVAAGPRRSGVRRWALPVSLAAVLVLSVSVVTLMREQGADRPESMISPPAQNPTAAMQSEIVPRESAEPPTPAAPEAMPRRRSAPPVAAPPASVAQDAAPAPAPVLSGRVAEAERAANESRAKTMAAESSHRAGDRPALRDYAAPQPLQRSAPASMAAEMSGGAGTSASASAKATAPAVLSAAPAKGVLWQDLVKEPPEKWLQRITELRRDGRAADAEALLAEFRRRFPDARLPEELR